MGEVYEAEDTELRDCVAIKVLKADYLEDGESARRLRREVHLARQVTHRNVCRLHDLFHVEHDGRDLTFVTMELLKGETLQQRLSQGRLQFGAALDVASQLAAGIDAAHEAGVIHRDLKPGNVILVPAGDGTERAVITDFGLAFRMPSAVATTETATAAGQFLGTPAYVSPEQLAGEPITTASDLYSFGVLLFELLTGQLPFSGGGPLRTALARLEHPAPAARTLEPSLPPNVEGALQRCLARDPSDRFQSARQTVDALLTQPRPLPRGARAQMLVAAGLVALLTVLGVGVWMTRNRPPEQDARGVGGSRDAVAVLGFRNLAMRQEFAWLSTALTEMITVELSAAEQVRIVPGEAVSRVRTDLQLADADAFAADTLSRIRGALGVDYVIVGSYVALGRQKLETVRVDVRVQNARTGETLMTTSQEGSEAELFDVVGRAGASVRQKLGVSPTSDPTGQVSRFSIPQNGQAARLYILGLEHLRHFDALAARDSLQKAIALEPDHALAHFALSEAWSILGYDEQARASATRAVELSQGLTRQQQLIIEARRCEAFRDWQKAVDVYRSLITAYPDNVDYGLRLSDALLATGEAVQSRAVLARLRQLKGPAGRDPRIDLAASAAALYLSEYEEAAEVARSAAQAAGAIGALSLRARAKIDEAWALYNLGKRQESKQASEEARQLYASIGDQRGVSRALIQLGPVLRDDGKLDEALTAFDQALKIAESLGNQRAIAQATNNLGNVYFTQRRLALAERAYAKALEAGRTISDRQVMAWAFNNLAQVMNEAGDLRGAVTNTSESLVIFRAAGMRRGIGVAVAHLGELQLELGKPAEARASYEEAGEVAKAIGNAEDRAYAALGLAITLRHMAAWDDARSRGLEALGLFTSAGNAEGSAEAQLALALVALARGDNGEAERVAISALKLLDEDDTSATAARCRLALALSQLRRGITPANRPIEVREPSLSQAWPRSARIQVALGRAAVDVESGRAALAIKDLERVSGDCRRFGAVMLGLQADLIRARGLRAVGRRAAARSAAKSAGLTADRHGLKQLSGEADAIAKGV